MGGEESAWWEKVGESVRGRGKEHGRERGGVRRGEKEHAHRRESVVS